MKREDAQHMAIQLMQLHGLQDWVFRFNRARRRMGACFYPAIRIIPLSAENVIVLKRFCRETNLAVNDGRYFLC